MAQPYLIDIEQILRNKMGSKTRFVPRLLVNYLKRIVHQDWLNDFILREGEKEGVPWLEDCMQYLSLNIEVHGLENLPSDTEGRRFTFVSNHPIGGPDGVILGAVLGRHYKGRIRFLANDLLMNLTGLAPLFIPINKTGRNGRDFPRMVDAAFRGDHHVIMFPAGLCSRKIDGKIQDVAWKKTFISKSIETKRDVIPIHFSGRNSSFFYRLANLSKWLGIKFNIAMLYLVDELYKKQGHTFTIHIGKPIPWQHFSSEKSATQWAAIVRQQVYDLPQPS